MSFEEVREAIRRGEVEIGFDEDMVRLAVGSPDPSFSAQNAMGNSSTGNILR